MFDPCIPCTSNKHCHWCGDQATSVAKRTSALPGGVIERVVFECTTCHDDQTALEMQLEEL